jgi:hypothetical protein
VATERWLAGRRGRRVLVAVSVVVLSLFSVASALPLLPRDRLAGSLPAAANPTIADQIGWPEYVQQVAGVYAALPAEDQALAVLVAGNYGEAGALDRYGPRHGLPAVYSGHNELYHFGPPPDDRTVAIVVSQAPPERVAALFGVCVAGPGLRNDLGVENEELEARVYVCRPTEPWRTLWPRLQHYD